MREAAEALRLTAQDLHQLGVADEVIAEPVGGAQRNPTDAIASVGEKVSTLLEELSKSDAKSLRAARRKKYLDMGSKALVA